MRRSIVLATVAAFLGCEEQAKELENDCVEIRNPVDDTRHALRSTFTAFRSTDKRHLCEIAKTFESTKLTDTWGRKPRITCTNTVVELRSPGADGNFDTTDDVIEVFEANEGGAR